MKRQTNRVYPGSLMLWLVALITVMVLLVAAAIAYSQRVVVPESATATASPTAVASVSPTPTSDATPLAETDAGFTQTDQALEQIDTALTSAGSGINDTQGDLSE